MKKIIFMFFWGAINPLFSQEFYRADSLFQAGNYDKALATYMKSNNDFKFFKIAKFYENQENFTSAIDNFKIYIHKFPNDYNSNFEYAKFLYDHKLIDQSIEILKKLVQQQENTLV
ncbi:MAG: tetratricopeptide repeat protein, partial [Flavobacterium sp.]